MKTIISDIPERDVFSTGGKSIEIGYPWITYGSIMALELVLNKNFLVLEFGCGGSTIFFAQRCKFVISIESDLSWVNKVKEGAKEKNLNNIEIFHFGDLKKYIEFINQKENNYFDLILIDSNPGINRLSLANASLSKLKVGGWLVIDNYNEFSMQHFSYPVGWEIWTYDDFASAGKGTRICKKI